MESISNIVNTIRPASRDDYGVSELLDAVAKRSSCSETERQEVSQMVRRVRTSVNRPKAKPRPSPVKIMMQQQGGDSSSNDEQATISTKLWKFLKPNTPVEAKPQAPKWKGDVLEKKELLRGFGPSPPVKKSSTDDGVVGSYPSGSSTPGGLFRDFGPSQAIETDSQTTSDGSMHGSEESFEEDQKL